MFFYLSLQWMKILLIDNLKQEMKMKKRILKSLAFAMMSIISLAFVSCGDDENEPQKNNDILVGKVTVKYEGAITETLYAYDATWREGHQEVHGTVLDNLENGATFVVTLSEDAPSEVLVLDGGVLCDMTAQWQFETPDEVKQGLELEIDKSQWGYSYDFSYWCKEFSGSVRVKSKKGKKITLTFNNFKINRLTVFRPGDSSFQDLTINGEITFDHEED